MAHFLVRQVKDIERRAGAVGGFHLTPSLIDKSPKAALETDVVLKYKGIGGIGLCNRFPDIDMRACNGDFCVTHPNRPLQVEGVWDSLGLRFDKQLVAERVIRINVNRAKQFFGIRLSIAC